ncbi:methylated-DNA--[protein]-cysteine S-methyltransferase [Microbacterium sp. GXF7504]
MIRSRFTVHPTPVGDALLLRSDEGLIGLELLHDPLGAALERWARRLGAASEPDDAGFEQVTTELDEYFEGARRAFEVPLDWRLTRGFPREALQATVGIPYGETAGYGEVALLAGHPRAARAVGTACATTPFSIVVPVHRVVRADGSIGEYGGHPEVKRFLLDLEAQAVAGV